jgi:hypothetical protein
MATSSTAVDTATSIFSLAKHPDSVAAEMENMPMTRHLYHHYLPNTTNF